MGAVTGETALYPCLQEKKEGKKTMSTKDVSCLAAPWVNSEPCGGVVVLPGALTHHVCVWLVPSPWQHWGGGREPGSAFTQLVPKQYGQAPQRSCPKPTSVVLKRHPRAGDTGHSTGGKHCLLSYKAVFFCPPCTLAGTSARGWLCPAAFLGAAPWLHQPGLCLSL